MVHLKYLLRIVSATGAAVFLAGFLLTYADQQYLEKHAREHIASEVREHAEMRLASLRNESLPGMLKMLASKYEKRIDALEQELNEGFDERMKSVFALMGNPDCECRRWLKEDHREGLKQELLLERNKAEVVKTLLMAGYGEVVQNLREDIRIFTLSSFLAFLLVLLATIVKPAARVHLMLPASLLVPSTLIAAWFYLIEQNWFYTILTNSYVGFGYTVWLLLIFGFLFDVLFNRARITTQIINALASAVGSAFSAVPC